MVVVYRNLCYSEAFYNEVELYRVKASKNATGMGSVILFRLLPTPWSRPAGAI